MFKTQCVLGLLALFVEFAHPWDFAVSRGDLLDFYTDETKIDTIRIPSHNLAALTYDEVHNMVLYVDKQNKNDSICVYDISSQLNQCLIERNGRNIHGLAFDPATELLFFSDTNKRSIYWISLKSGSDKYVHLFLKMHDVIPTDLAVDSCRGYIYWININPITPTIERARLTGSERKYYNSQGTIFLKPGELTNALRQTQKMYWINPKLTAYTHTYRYRDSNGENHIWLSWFSYSGMNVFSNTSAAIKTNLFWVDWCFECAKHVKNLEMIVAKGYNLLKSQTEGVTVGIVANYKIKERIQETDDCEALKRVEQRISDEPFCVHGMKILGKSLCKCAPGYIGERCDVSICESYCLHGSCTFNNEGLPNCRCHGDYSGERCEVDACHGFCLNDGYCYLNEQRESVCQCKGGHAGDRCEVSGCVNYCLHGNCTINDERLPTCSCEAGHSGERCEVDVCLGYCMNNGECSLNEEDEPTCACGGSYDGPRCEAVTITFTLPSNAFSDESNLNFAGLLPNCKNNQHH